MLDLNQMAVFIRVVQEGSFTAAARSLNIPKSRVSRMITDLEDKLNLRLLERTTREVRPTDVGLQYYQQYKPLFAEITDIHTRISDYQHEPSGQLKISAPVGFAIEIMGRWTAEFKALYPKIDLDLVFSDSDIHLVRDGFDLGFVIGHQEDSSLIARKFYNTAPILCASPSFIKEYGPFTHPTQLNEVPWISIAQRPNKLQNEVLTHKKSGEQVLVKPKSSIKANHNDVALHHMLAGQGVAISTEFFTFEELLTGQLEPILPEWQVQDEPIYLVFPSGRHQAKKVRVFIDFVVEKSSQLQALIDQCEPLSKKEKIIHMRSVLKKHSFHD